MIKSYINQAFINEEKIKGEITNSYSQSIQYLKEIDNINQILNESFISKD